MICSCLQLENRLPRKGTVKCISPSGSSAEECHLSGSGRQIPHGYVRILADSAQLHLSELPHHGSSTLQVQEKCSLEILHYSTYNWKGPNWNVTAAIVHIIQRSEMKVSAHKGGENTSFEENGMRERTANKKQRKGPQREPLRGAGASASGHSIILRCASATDPSKEHQGSFSWQFFSVFFFLPQFDKCLFFFRYYSFAIKYFQRGKHTHTMR